MSSPNILVLDANILIRAVLGNKIRELLLNNSNTVNFFTPDICLQDAKKYLPIIFEKRGLSFEPAFKILSNLECLIQIVDETIYQEQILEAKARMKNHDINDWPVVATALTLNCPIWTEDKDFFGSGLPIWTTDRIHLFFKLHHRIVFSASVHEPETEYLIS